MINSRKQLARLNGRSDPDIAAALAFVPRGLGREVLEACWWPSGAALHSQTLRDAVYAHVRPELDRQARSLIEARTHRGMMSACAGWVRSPGEELRRELAAAEAAVEAVKVRSWPGTAWDMLPAITQTVIHEIASPNQCSDCGGRGERLSGHLVIVCATCGGRGTLPVSDRKRAASIGRDESTYRANWRPMYEWLLRELQDAEREAARQLGDALQQAA